MLIWVCKTDIKSHIHIYSITQKYYFLCDMMRYFNAIMKMYINAKNQQKYVYNPKKFSNLLNEIHWVIWLERHAIKRQTTWQAQNVKQESSLHVLYLLFIVTIFMNLIFKKSSNNAGQTHRGPNCLLLHSRQISIMIYEGFSLTSFQEP